MNNIPNDERPEPKQAELRNPQRITMKLVSEEVLAFCSLEKGAIRTTRELAMRPAQMIRHYLQGDRSSITNPLRYLAMSTALVTVFFILFLPLGTGGNPAQPEYSFDEPVLGEVDTSELDEKVDAADALLLEIVSSTKDEFRRMNAEEAHRALRETFTERLAAISMAWMNFFLLIALPMNTLLCFLAFRGKSFNLAEHVTINAFILGFRMCWRCP